MEGLAVKVPGGEELETLAFGLGPGGAVRKGREEHEDHAGEDKEGNGSDLVEDRTLSLAESRETGRGEVKGLAQGDDGEVQGGEVVVEEELTLHEVEGEVVESPAQDGGADLVVEALEGGARVVVAAALPADNGHSLEDSPSDDGSGR